MICEKCKQQTMGGLSQLGECRKCAAERARHERERTQFLKRANKKEV